MANRQHAAVAANSYHWWVGSMRDTIVERPATLRCAISTGLIRQQTQLNQVETETIGFVVTYFTWPQAARWVNATNAMGDKRH